ncbi:alpha/beta hydrolase [Breoghania sp. L-A4]|uniref:alpha/beta hydrolase n=1 Tax=Breoghania sp. L-A4 TaxID=2304600 RepID=UPI0019683CFC|nr:alpha/beta hydrolase [Breoghania sp. L-A4]
MPLPDPTVFSDEAISDETRRFNAETLATLSALPDQWSVPPDVIRRLRAEGRGPFPLPPKCPRAETVTIDGPHGPVPLRIIPPENGTPTGVFLHVHGGGWTFGTADSQDDRLDEITRRTGAAVISVEYRLAPEHPYPQGPDDCEAAALWLLREATTRFGTDRLAIGGESAGAHLAVVTMVRLRDWHGLTPFCAAALTAGCFDMRLSPSARNWGSDKLILNTRDITKFAQGFLGDGQDRSNPDISPINADLSRLPPALFSIGTRDPLLDDSLFMAARWQAAGCGTELSVTPGGCHMFQAFPLRIAHESNAEIDGFLRAHIGAPSV